MPSVDLSALRAGESGTIAAVSAANGVGKRLADIGFVRGAVIRMLHPGRNCIVCVDQTRLGLGEAVQTTVLVDRIE